MIISHKYKFIFLKTTKTAGTSVEIALSKFCGVDDIITAISPEDEKTRSDLGYPGPQNHFKYGPRDWINILRRKKRRKLFYNHITAEKVTERIKPDIWDSYYKFCFERNPWDRAISTYYWLYKTEPRPTITEFIKSDALLSLKRRGFDLYTLGGEIAVDKVCRFEAISDELEEIRKRLGIPEKLELPHAKSKFRKDKRSYRDILGEEEKDIIAELFHDEIDLLGYEF